MSDITAQDIPDLHEIDHSHDEIISQIAEIHPHDPAANEDESEEEEAAYDVAEEETAEDAVDASADYIANAQAAYEENLAALPQELSVFKPDQFVTERIYVTDTLVAEAVCSSADDLEDTSMKGHVYGIINPDREFLARNGQTFGGGVQFQMGPVKDAGVNGFTNEVLLAILIHRTTHLNSLYPCAENETAIAAMQTALDAFNARTANREARGVEGTLQA
jgi:hypothetical protein